MVDAPLRLTGQDLTLQDLASVALQQQRVEIHPDAMARMQRSRAFVETVAASDQPTYGINTGFGALAEVSIPHADLLTLQRNLILSHAVGVGIPLSPQVSRAMMVLRANVLCTGHAGVRPLVAQTLCTLINAGVAPHVPSRGSVGASGDLAPLAHVALLLLGEGPAWLERNGSYAQVTAAEALAFARLSPVVLQAKEGLALVNGTQAMAATGGHALLEALRLADLADVCGAATVEAVLASHKPFDPRIQAARPHPGQARSAANVRGLLAESQIAPSHEHCAKVQDPYSLRCTPQVHGATRDALSFVESVLQREINSATDNPLVFAEDQTIISGGNFHGQPLALALDLLAMAVSELGSISERRMEQLLNPAYSGLPPFLVAGSGLNSGFMICQVTAAALLNENKVLCHPASVDSIPSSANREDHVSMGMTAALKAQTVVDNTRRILGMELMMACQALDMRAPLQPGRGVSAVHRLVRQRVPHLDADRLMQQDLQAMDALCQDHAWHTAAGVFA